MLEAMSEKRSVALVIERDVPGPATPDEWLLVQRPEDDEDLPGVWGLPAGSFVSGEDEDGLVRRIGRDKLGLDLTNAGRLESGSTARAAYDLHMVLIRATVSGGEPAVARDVDGVTQYSAWKWGAPAELADGARRGSLCCQLALRSVGL